MSVFEHPAYGLERDLEVLVINPMQHRGVRFDVQQAQALLPILETALGTSAEELQRLFPPKTVYEEFIPKRDNKTKGYAKGAPFQKSKMVPFNPNSTAHAAERAIDLGYVVSDLTETGQARMDAEVLHKIAADYPPFQVLLEHKVTAKRKAMLAADP